MSEPESIVWVIYNKPPYRVLPNVYFASLEHYPLNYVFPRKGEHLFIHRNALVHDHGQVLEKIIGKRIKETKDLSIE